MSKFWIAVLLICSFFVFAKDAPKTLVKPAECTLEAVPGWPMKYCDLVQGTGAAAAAGDKLSVTYVAWLANGDKFDEASDKRKPFKFVLGARKVIKGWDIGLDGMQAGGKRQLRIPSSMAYGMGGRPPVIPPDADLIFDVELLEVKKAKN